MDTMESTLNALHWVSLDCGLLRRLLCAAVPNGAGVVRGRVGLRTVVLNGAGVVRGKAGLRVVAQNGAGVVQNGTGVVCEPGVAQNGAGVVRSGVSLRVVALNGAGVVLNGARAAQNGVGVEDLVSSLIEVVLI